MNIIDWLKELGISVNHSELIEQSFIHSSYVNEHPETLHDNERLEFMGDAVLQVWVSKVLYLLQPSLHEGEMTTLRAQLVCEEALAEYSRKLELNQFLKLGFGEEKTGGRNRNSVIADAFEAFLGALYLDGGFESVDVILRKTVPVPSLSKTLQLIVDYKSRLQEFAQSDDRKTLSYELLSSSGPSNKLEFEVAVVVDGILMGKGKGNSKKKAEQAAAKNALEKLVR